MIIVSELDSSSLSIDFAKESRFRPEKHAIEIGTAFNVLETSSSRLIIEDGGQRLASIEFISRTLRDYGFAVKLDSEIGTQLKRVAAEKALAQSVAQAKTARARISPSLLSKIKRPLLKHQIRAVLHALSVHNGANFSVPGSGKTQVALVVFAAMRDARAVERLLVIGPASSFRPWEDEYRSTFGKNPVVVRLIGNRTVRESLFRHLSSADLVLCTYQMAYRERDNLIRALRTTAFFLVLDESHYIKNIALGPWSDTAIQLAPYARRRMILTGTPAPHSLLDLWTQFTFLWPTESVLGSKLDFERMVAARDAKSQIRKKLGPFFIRVKKADLKLPRPRYRFESITDIPERQRLIIRLLELKTLQQARVIGLGNSDLATLRNWRRARIIRLMQAASNPALLSGSAIDLGPAEDSMDRDPTLAPLLADYLRAEIPAKIDWVTKKVRSLISQGKKVVVWASFIDNLLLLKKLLREQQPLLAYGGIPAYADDLDPEFETRERNISLFKSDSRYQVLLANPGACAESISLHQVCQNAIYLERTFNCGQFLQSLDRIHRVKMPSGTTATYHIPILACAIERTINTRLAERQKVLYEVLNDDMPVLSFPDGTALVEDEEDIDVLFERVMQEIRTSVTEQPARKSRRTGARGRDR